MSSLTEPSQLLWRKQSKAPILRALYARAQESVALPVPLESQAIATFRLTLTQHLELCPIRAELEETAHELRQSRLDYQILRSVPGVGPIIALTVLAEAGDLRRFRHERQFLKFCGLDLATSRSGAYRGRTQLSKRGNSRLRSPRWMAARRATHMQENTFRQKFSRYLRFSEITFPYATALNQKLVLNLSVDMPVLQLSRRSLTSFENQHRIFLRMRDR